MADEGSWISGILGSLMQVYSVYESQKRQREIEDEKRALFQKYATALTPEAESKGIQALTQPLSEQFKDVVAKNVGAMLAQRGISGGGFLAQALADALAPYDIDLLKQAQSAYFQGLNLPIAAEVQTPNAQTLQNNPFAFIQAIYQNKAFRDALAKFATKPSDSTTDISGLSPSLLESLVGSGAKPVGSAPDIGGFTGPFQSELP